MSQDLISRMSEAANEAGGQAWTPIKGSDPDGQFDLVGPFDLKWDIATIQFMAACHVVDSESPSSKFIALCNPSNVLKLLEAHKEMKLALEGLSGLDGYAENALTRVSEILETKGNEK